MFNRDELNRLYRYAVSLSRKEEDGADLLQTTLVKLFERSGRIEVEYPIRYAMRTIRNTFLNSLRTSNREEAIEDENTIVDKNIDLNKIISNKIEVEEVLSFCNPLEREILYLWAYEGMTYVEISGFLEISKGTLLTKIHNLKKRINESLELKRSTKEGVL